MPKPTRDLCPNCHARTLVDGACSRCSVAEFPRAPLSPPEVRTHPPARNVDDLYPRLLGGAELALDKLEAGMRYDADARTLKELSMAANTLMRAARYLEKPEPEQPSADEMAAAEAEAERLLHEARRRGGRG